MGFVRAHSGSINMFSSSLKGKDKHMSGKIHEWLKLMAVRYKGKKEVVVYLYEDVFGVWENTRVWETDDS